MPRASHRQRPTSPSMPHLHKARRVAPLGLALAMLAALPAQAQGPAPERPAPGAPARGAPGTPHPGPRGTAASAANAGPSNGIVAVVNGDVVSRADVESRKRLFALNAGLPASPEVLNRLTTQVTRLLIDERLRMQEVQRRRVPVMDEDIGDAIAEVEKRNNLPPGGLAAQIKAAGAEPRVFYDQLRAQIGWARLIRGMLGDQANPSDAEVKEVLDSIKARTGQPEYLVSEIFVPVDSGGGEADTRKFVDDIVTQLRSGIPFAIAATQFSQAQSALTGGDIGWTQPNNLDPEVARVVTQMPVGAISNAIKVPGGYTIVALRQKRLVGRDDATILTMRQVFWHFATPLNPDAPTDQQRELVERARAMQGKASCEQVEAAAKAAGGDHPPDPGQVRLEAINPPPLRQLLATLPLNKASQPIISQDGVMVLAVCSRETQNLAEVTPEQAKNQLVRERAENLARQMQRDLRRRAQIEMRGS